MEKISFTKPIVWDYIFIQLLQLRIFWRSGKLDYSDSDSFGKERTCIDVTNDVQLCVGVFRNWRCNVAPSVQNGPVVTRTLTVMQSGDCRWWAEAEDDGPVVLYRYGARAGVGRRIANSTVGISVWTRKPRTQVSGGYLGKGAISLVATWLGRSPLPCRFLRRRRCFSLISKAACILADTAVLIQPRLPVCMYAGRWPVAATR